MKFFPFSRNPRRPVHNYSTNRKEDSLLWLIRLDIKIHLFREKNISNFILINY